MNRIYILNFRKSVSVSVLFLLVAQTHRQQEIVQGDWEYLFCATELVERLRLMRW